MDFYDYLSSPEFIDGPFTSALGEVLCEPKSYLSSGEKERVIEVATKYASREDGLSPFQQEMVRHTLKASAELFDYVFFEAIENMDFDEYDESDEE